MKHVAKVHYTLPTLSIVNISKKMAVYGKQKIHHHFWVASPSEAPASPQRPKPAAPDALGYPQDNPASPANPSGAQLAPKTP